MIGIIIQLFISWILLRFIEKENLMALGIKLSAQRLKYIAIGLLFPIIYYTILFIVLAYVGKNPYQLNNSYTFTKFLGAIWYLFKAVAFETLIFHGAILYILIKRLGVTKAVIISAVAFGIYHWFSWGLFGNPSAMAVTFLTTGIMGYLWAVAFNKTKSIYLPFALHFGVDFVSMILFSKEKSIGQQLLIKTYATDPYSPAAVIAIPLLILYFTGFPILLFFYLKNIRIYNRTNNEIVTSN